MHSGEYYSTTCLLEEPRKRCDFTVVMFIHNPLHGVIGIEKKNLSSSFFFLFPLFVHIVSSSLLPWFVIPFHSSFLLSFFVYQISMNSPRESWTWVWDTGSRNLKCLHIRLLARFSWAFWKRRPFLSIDLWFIYKVNSVLQRFSWGSRTQDSILPLFYLLADQILLLSQSIQGGDREIERRKILSFRGKSVSLLCLSQLYPWTA